MYRNNFIIFLASYKEGQVFFVCPAILEGFWTEYVDSLPSETKVDVLMKWDETVPENLRKKIQKFSGEFMPFESYLNSTMKEIEQVSTGFVMSLEPPFNPYKMAKTLSESIQSDINLKSKPKPMFKKGR